MLGWCRGANWALSRSNMPEPIRIAFACNDGYAQHVAVVIRSILASAHPSDQHEFHVFSTDLTSQSVGRLKETAAPSMLEVHAVDSARLAGFPDSRHTRNAFIRLLLPELLPGINSILYLDADLLVFDSLRDLADISLADVPASAAMDSLELWGGLLDVEVGRIQQNGAHRYFNSGVMVLNLDLWRREGLTAKIAVWCRENADKLIHADQTALNVLLANRIRYIHLRWNLQIPLIEPVRYGWNHTTEMAEAVAQPGIIHFVTARKPWCRQHRVPYQEHYFRFRSETPWQSDPLPALSVDQRCQWLVETLAVGRKGLRSQLRKVMGLHRSPTELVPVTTPQSTRGRVVSKA